MSPEKSLGASLEKGLKVKRESRVPTFEKNNTKNPLVMAEEVLVEGAADEEEEVVAEVEDWRWKSEVRWSTISRYPLSRSQVSNAGSGTLRDKGLAENTIFVVWWVRMISFIYNGYTNKVYSY